MYKLRCVAEVFVCIIAEWRATSGTGAEKNSIFLQAGKKEQLCSHVHLFFLEIISRMLLYLEAFARGKNSKHTKKKMCTVDKHRYYGVQNCYLLLLLPLLLLGARRIHQ